MKHFCKIHFAFLLILTVLLNGCVKNAPESITQAALHQADVIEAKITKECPQIEIRTDIMALKSTIRGQLSSCEDLVQIYKERNNALWLAIIALVVLWLVGHWAKIKTRIFK